MEEFERWIKQAKADLDTAEEVLTWITNKLK